MKYCILVCLFFFLSSTTLSAQYKKPNSVAYQSSTGNYLITATESGKVYTLTQSKVSSEVISGLTAPTGILFVNLGSNSAIAVLDQTKIKLFDPSNYSSLINIDVTNAKDLQDAVLHPSNSNVFFLSDKAGGRVIKASVGSAPFYPITWSTFNNTIPKPNAMFINNNGKMIVASDTVDGGIYEVNLTTGKSTLVKSLKLDNVNGITQDDQDNYYVSNWGDDYVYRFPGNWSDSSKVIIYTDPAGMYFHKSEDRLVIACSGCGKVEYLKLHRFELDTDISTCENDSFTATKSFWFKSYGTFDKNNRFYIEVSDSNGSFTNSFPAGYVIAQEMPTSFKGKLPKQTYGSNHKVRLRSTNPVAFSEAKKLTIWKAPDALAYPSDTLKTCVGGFDTLGIDSKPNTDYVWSSTQTIVDPSLARIPVSLSNKGSYSYYLRFEDTLTTCYGMDTALVLVNDGYKFHLPDSVLSCEEDSLLLTLPESPEGSYWINDISINRTDLEKKMLFNKKASGMVSFKYQAPNSCISLDSFFYEFFELPAEMRFDYKLCRQEAIDHSIKPLPNYKYSWTADSVYIYSDTTTYTNTRFQVHGYVIGKKYELTETLVHKNGCSTTNPITLELYPPPSVKRDLNVAVSGDTVSIKTERSNNNTIYWVLRKLNKDTVQLRIDEEEIRLVHGEDFVNGYQIHAVHTNAHGCIGWTSPETLEVEIVGIDQLMKSSLAVYPNPFTNELTVSGVSKSAPIKIYNMQGQMVFEKEIRGSESLNVSGLSRGVYFVQIEGVRKMLVKE